MKLYEHLDKLYAFQVIIKAGTLSQAAEELHLTQPSLTRLIQTLEQASGVRLVSTGRNGVKATSAGKLLFKYSLCILKDLADLEEKLKHPEDLLSGQLKIGSYESLAEYLWPDFLNHFQQTTPNLKLSVHTKQTSQHIKALEESEVDILVDAEPRLVGDYISWVLYEDMFNVFIGKKYSKAIAKQLVLDLPLIYCPSAFDRHNKTILQHLEEQGLRFKQTIELDSFTSVRTFCEKGLGVGVIPNQLANQSIKNKTLYHATLQGFSKKGFGPHDITATVKASQSDDPRIKHLLKSLRSWLKKS